MTLWPKAQAKLREAMKRMVRCGGRVEFSMSPEYDEGGDTGGIDTYLQCAQCGETVHALRMDSELVEQWIQERLDREEPND